VLSGGRPPSVGAPRRTPVRSAEPPCRRCARRRAVRLVPTRLPSNDGPDVGRTGSSGVSGIGPAWARATASPAVRSDQVRWTPTSTRACQPSSRQLRTRAAIARPTRSAAAQACACPPTGSPAAASAARSAAAWARCRVSTAPPRSSSTAVRTSRMAAARAAHTVATPRSRSSVPVRLPQRPRRRVAAVMGSIHPGLLCGRAAGRPGCAAAAPIRRGCGDAGGSSAPGTPAPSTGSGRSRGLACLSGCRADDRGDGSAGRRRERRRTPGPRRGEDRTRAQARRREEPVAATAAPATGRAAGVARSARAGGGSATVPVSAAETGTCRVPGSRRAVAEPLTAIGRMRIGATETVARTSSPTSTSVTAAPAGASSLAAPRARSASPRDASRAASRAASVQRTAAATALRAPSAARTTRVSALSAIAASTVTAPRSAALIRTWPGGRAARAR
jgi:hypothetical protein